MPVPYDHEHERDVIYFARTNYRNSMRKFGIKTDDRRRHMYVIGKTGMGKTTLLENMILADIYLGHGCAYVDPHGDTAQRLLDFIPPWRLQDVIYLNPADVDHPMGFNILENTNPHTRHVVAAGLMGVFKKIWPDVWSARMEHILNNCLLTLLENPGNTLLGINRLLVDKDFRRAMVAGVVDPVVKAFWLTEYEMWDPKFRTEAIAPIQNKVGQFLSTAMMRNIVAQSASTIHIRQIMDEGKIFIVDLSKGRIGEDAMRLLGGMLITKMQLSAMERVDIPREEDRRDFYAYIDEFQNFATESFATILSEARKYRLDLIMAHQYIEQLDETVKAAVFGNVGTIIAFRVGSADAADMEVEFAPRFTPEDLVNLAKYDVYLRLMIDGVASEPFSARTLPPIAQRTGSQENVVESSRRIFGRDRVVVEQEISNWAQSSPVLSEEGATIFAKVDQQRKEVKQERRPMFEYNCTRCGTLIKLPVELDRSRPIYCDDCIAIIRAEKKGRRPMVGKIPIPPPPPRVSEGQSLQQPIVGEVKITEIPRAEVVTKPAAPAATPVAPGTSDSKRRRRKRSRGSTGGIPGASGTRPPESQPPTPPASSAPPVSFV